MDENAARAVVATLVDEVERVVGMEETLVDLEERIVDGGEKLVDVEDTVVVDVGGLSSSPSSAVSEADLTSNTAFS